MGLDSSRLKAPPPDRSGLLTGFSELTVWWKYLGPTSDSESTLGKTQDFTDAGCDWCHALNNSSWRSRESQRFLALRTEGKRQGEREEGRGLHPSPSFVLLLQHMGRGGPGGDTQGYKLIPKVLSPARVLGLQRGEEEQGGAGGEGRRARRRRWDRGGAGENENPACWWFLLFLRATSWDQRWYFYSNWNRKPLGAVGGERPEHRPFYATCGHSKHAALCLGAMGLGGQCGPNLSNSGLRKK